MLARCWLRRHSAALAVVLMATVGSITACTPSDMARDHPAPTGTPSPLAAPLATAAAPSATTEPTPTDDATVTATPSPTLVVLRPPSVDALTPTPGSTWKLVPTPAGLPTVSTERFDECCPSPDGRWVVRKVATDPMQLDENHSGWSWYYRALEVAAADGSVTYSVIDEWSNFGLGAPYPAVLGWLPDSSAVYVLEEGRGDGCDLFGWGRDLVRLEVTTGEIETVVPDGFNAPTLHASGERVAYERADLVVEHDLVSGAVVHGAAPWRQVGGFQWSPDRSAIAFSFTDNACSSMGVATFNLDSRVVRAVWPERPGGWSGSWLDDDTLEVVGNPRAFQLEAGEKERAVIDAWTGERLEPRP